MITVNSFKKTCIAIGYDQAFADFYIFPVTESFNLILIFLI